MRWLILFLCCLPALASATGYTIVTFKAPASYTLSPTDVQLMCTSLYGELTTDALNSIELLAAAAVPYSCQLDADQKTLVIKFTLKTS